MFVSGNCQQVQTYLCFNDGKNNDYNNILIYENTEATLKITK